MADRFIPRRDPLDLQISSFKLKNVSNAKTTLLEEILDDSLFDGRIKGRGILNFKKFETKTHKMKSPPKPLPPFKPSRIVDIPGFTDDFYNNNLDVNANDIIALSVNSVFLLLFLLICRKYFFIPSETGFHTLLWNGAAEQGELVFLFLHVDRR